METFLKISGITVKIVALEVYDRGEVENLARKTPEESFDETFVKGSYKVDSITFLQEEYKEKALWLAGRGLKELRKELDKIDNTRCETTLEYYYS